MNRGSDPVAVIHAVTDRSARRGLQARSLGRAMNARAEPWWIRLPERGGGERGAPVPSRALSRASPWPGRGSAGTIDEIQGRLEPARALSRRVGTLARLSLASGRVVLDVCEAARRAHDARASRIDTRGLLTESGMRRDAARSCWRRIRATKSGWRGLWCRAAVRG